MKKNRMQCTLLIFFSILLFFVFQLYAGYKLKWQSPHTSGTSFLYDVPFSPSIAEIEKCDMDGDSIPEIVYYNDDTLSSHPGAFEIIIYDSRNYNEKWRYKGVSSNWGAEHRQQPLIGFFDIDADGKKEAVLDLVDTVRIIDWTNNNVELEKTGWAPFAFDIDKDGYPEVAFRIEVPQRHWEVWGNDLNIGIHPDLNKQKGPENALNIFHNQTMNKVRINYQVQTEGIVSIKIYNVAGLLIKELINERKNIGEYNVLWDGSSNSGARVASGTYYYQLSVGRFKSGKKAILLK